MPLTPEDVQKKTFTPVRLREGYDMGEVDQFLDEVETELTRLHQENDELRRSRADTDVTDGSQPTAPAPRAATPEPPPPLPVVTTVPEAASAAARLLEIATNNAEQLVSEAKDNADAIIAEARTKADRLQSESKARVDQLEQDARNRAEHLDSETNERRQQLLGGLERDKDAMARELEELRSFEREYRSRLKTYFEAQLQALDGQGDGAAPLTPAAEESDTPPRLRELLGEEG